MKDGYGVTDFLDERRKTVFIAEIKEVKQRKTASLDNEYSIKFVTDNSLILELGKIQPDQLVKVIVEEENG